MNIHVAGKDRTADLEPAIAAEAARLKASGSIAALSPEHSAQVLKESAGADDYLRRFVALLRLRHGVRTADYYIPRGPGLRGKVALVVKTFFWKLLRYQHDRIVFQQNLINELAIDALEFQQDRLEGEVADLRRRIASLESGRTKGAAS